MTKIQTWWLKNPTLNQLKTELDGLTKSRDSQSQYIRKLQDEHDRKRETDFHYHESDHDILYGPVCALGEIDRKIDCLKHDIEILSAGFPSPEVLKQALLKLQIAKVAAERKCEEIAVLANSGDVEAQNRFYHQHGYHCEEDALVGPVSQINDLNKEILKLEKSIQESVGQQDEDWFWFWK